MKHILTLPWTFLASRLLPTPSRKTRTASVASDDAEETLARPGTEQRSRSTGSMLTNDSDMATLSSLVYRRRRAEMHEEI